MIEPVFGNIGTAYVQAGFVLFCKSMSYFEIFKVEICLSKQFSPL